MSSKRNKPYAVVGSGMSPAQMVKQRTSPCFIHTVHIVNAGRNAMSSHIYYGPVYIVRKKNCLKREWPHLPNYIINNCLTPTTQAGETKLKAYLTEGDDSTIYMYTTEQDGSHPGMVLKYFPPFIEASQRSPPRVSTITLPPSYIPHGQPSNAPIRKREKTAVIVDPEDNDDVPLASAYLKQKLGQKDLPGTMMKKQCC